MESTTTKNYPVSTEEIAQIFGFHKAGLSVEKNTNQAGATSAPVNNLPIANLPVALVENSPETEALKGKTYEQIHQEADAIVQKTNVAGFLIKHVVPYVVLAVIGIFSYYFFFSKFDITKIFQSKQKVVVNTVKESALQTLEKQNSAAYLAWIKGFYFDVSDASLLDMEADNSGNGLSNFQKYLLGLNPKSYSSAGLNMADSEALSKGINPLSGKALTETQKSILEKYVDMEVVMNRLALAEVNVAGAKTKTGSFVPSSEFRAYSDSANNQATLGTTGFETTPSSNSEFPNRTTSNNSTVTTQNTTNTTVRTPPRTGANTTAQAPVINSIGINGLEIDESKPGLLEIPSINVTVPVTWTKSTKNFTTDLQNGVVHYPGTALPGYIGTSYISGHSSNYKWAKGSFNQVFSTLNDVPDNTSFTITVTQKNGKQAVLHYVVTHRQEYKPTDQAQFANSDKSVVALSTCWPVGSTARRLVVFGEMTQMDKE